MNPNDVKDFVASKGWLQKFLKRTGFHNVSIQGEAASADSDGAIKFKREFSDFIKQEGYSSDQIFNADESGLSWKKMPRRSYVSKELKSIKGSSIYYLPANEIRAYGGVW